MVAKVVELQDDHHFMRHVSWTKLRRDEDDNVLGALPQAFELREGEKALSGNWLEFFEDPLTRRHDCARALRNVRHASKQSAFVTGNVGAAKKVCAERDVKIRIVHERKDGEEAHASIRQLPPGDLRLLAILADDVFIDLLFNSDVIG